MKGKNIKENIKTVLLALVLVFFVVIAICQFYEGVDMDNTSNRIVLGVNNSANETLVSALKGHPEPMGDYMGIVSGGNFTVIDTNANVLTKENFMLSDPILHAKGNFCIVADYGGNTVKLYEKGKVVTTIETESQVISVVTNSNGFFAIATEETGYNAVITIYRKNGEAIYRYRISKNTFVDMDISANNRKLVVVEANLSNGATGSNVVLVDFNRSDAEKVFYVQSNVYVSVNFNKDGSFAALGNDTVDIYRADGGKIAEITLQGRQLIGADMTNEAICLAFSGAGDGSVGSSTLEIYDRQGVLKGSTVFDDEIAHVCVNDGYVSVSHGNKLDIVRSNGKIKKSFNSPSPVKFAAPFSGGNAAVMFSGGNTTVVK